MNPLQKIESKIKVLKDELSDTSQYDLICYQHTKMMLHFLELCLATGTENPKKRFLIAKEANINFFTAIIEAQNMGERMEKGLERRKKFMGDSEGDYQLKKL